MDEQSVKRLRSAVIILEQARNALDPAYRNEPFSTGTVDGHMMAVSDLISLVLINEGEQSEPLTLVRAEQTCFGCPSQWDAWDAEGNQYYLRFRHGFGSIDLRGRMVDGEMEWLDRGDSIATFTFGDQWEGYITLPEFADKAGIRLDGWLR